MDERRWYSPAFCPKNGEELVVVETAYGLRASCGEHGIRLTWIRGEVEEWVVESNPGGLGG